MAVCMTRANAVRLYDELKNLPGCPEVKVVMTGDLGKDPKAWIYLDDLSGLGAIIFLTNPLDALSSEMS